MSDALKELYPLILDSITEGVFTVDPEFRITYFNAEAEAITGFSREQALGHKCYEVLRASICQRGCAVRKSLETGEPQRNVRVTVLNPDMQAVPICVSSAVLRDRKGRMIGGVEIFRDISEVEALRGERRGAMSLVALIGASPAMQEIFRLIPDVAPTDAAVLIDGASGTGKAMLARAIHEQSSRSDFPFVCVNCGALPDTLLESELFGYVRGAFTGARESKPGRFQQADGGTLFLDEVGELSAAFQVKLLRALQEGEVQPLGGTEALHVDVRVIAATNCDLHQLMEEGKFREDLLLPSLRDPDLHTSPARTLRGHHSAGAALHAPSGGTDRQGDPRNLVRCLDRALRLRLSRERAGVEEHTGAGVRPVPRRTDRHRPPASGGSDDGRKGTDGSGGQQWHAAAPLLQREHRRGRDDFPSSC